MGKPCLLKNDYLAEIFLKNKQSVLLQGKQVVISGANNNIKVLNKNGKIGKLEWLSSTCRSFW